MTTTTPGLSSIVAELLADGDAHTVERGHIAAAFLRVPLRVLWDLTPAGELVPVSTWPADLPA